MAQAVGGSVRQVISVTENIGQSPQPLQGFGTAGTAASVVPVQPGQQTITAQVQVTYELR